MARYAMVQESSGVVVNVIEWDGNLETWQPSEGYIMVQDPDGMAGPGFTCVGDKFVPPPSGLPGAT